MELGEECACSSTREDRRTVYVRVNGKPMGSFCSAQIYRRKRAPFDYDSFKNRGESAKFVFYRQRMLFDKETYAFYK